MTTVARLAFLAFGLILAGWLWWLTATAQRILSHAEDLLDRQDRNNAPAARPRPMPGPATVPAPAVQIIGGAVTGRTATAGRHAKVSGE